MAYLNYGQKKLVDKLLITKYFSRSKDGSVEFTFEFTNKNASIIKEKLFLGVDESNNLINFFDINEYLEHKKHCCIRISDNFTIQEIDS